MTAEQAREISDRAWAERIITPYMDKIRDSAVRGEYHAEFGKLSDSEVTAFCNLGYTVESDSIGNRTVCWKPQASEAKRA